MYPSVQPVACDKGLSEYLGHYLFVYLFVCWTKLKWTVIKLAKLYWWVFDKVVDNLLNFTQIEPPAKEDDRTNNARYPLITH